MNTAILILLVVNIIIQILNAIVLDEILKSR